MLGCWSSQFRLFLSALDGDICPLCAVTGTIEIEEAVRTARKTRVWRAMCGGHLARVLARMGKQPSRVGAVRSTLGASMNFRASFECTICATRRRVVRHTALAIRWLDSRMSFQRAIEGAPLFCRDHVCQICDGGSAPNFRGIQRRKVQKLINELAQAQLRNRPDLEQLLSEATRFFGPPSREDATGHALVQSSDDTPADFEQINLGEFARWEGRRQLEYLGKLESEAASLRYRNAVLAEENRALKVARIAQQSIRRDLERDREELLAKESGAHSKSQL